MTSKESVHIPWAFSLENASRLPLLGEEHPLRREFSKWLYWAHGIAVVGGLVAATSWLLWNARGEQALATRQVQIVRYTDLSSPPSIARPAPPQVKIEQAVARALAAAPPKIAVPEPVPDEMAWETTIATQAEMSEALAPISLDDLGLAGGSDVVIDIPTGGRPSPDDFVPVEEEPIRISIDAPIYPEIAKEAGIQGTVIVRALVGKDGRVKDSLIIEGQDMLNEAALECARTAVFKPALWQRRPVEVWVLMPITFHLRK